MSSININYEGKTESHEMEQLPEIAGGSVELLSFIGQTTSYGKGFNKTLNSDTEIAILFYSYTLHSGGGDGTEYLPTINGEYTLLDEKVVTDSHWAYLYSKVIIIQKKKGDENVIVTFPSTSEHYFSQGYVVELGV